MEAWICKSPSDGFEEEFLNGNCVQWRNLRAKTWCLTAIVRHKSACRGVCPSRLARQPIRAPIMLTMFFRLSFADRGLCFSRPATEIMWAIVMFVHVLSPWDCGPWGPPVAPATNRHVWQCSFALWLRVVGSAARVRWRNWRADSLCLTMFFRFTVAGHRVWQPRFMTEFACAFWGLKLIQFSTWFVYNWIYCCPFCHGMHWNLLGNAVHWHLLAILNQKNVVKHNNFPRKLCHKAPKADPMLCNFFKAKEHGQAWRVHTPSVPQVTGRRPHAPQFARRKNMHWFGVVDFQASKWRIWLRMFKENLSIWLFGFPSFQVTNLIRIV